MDLHYDGDKLLFTATDTNNMFQVMEVGIDGKNLRQVSTIIGQYVHNYGGIYLPDERIVFSSTAPLIGVPCIGGSRTVPNLYVMDADGGNTRQLTFEQDADWYPTVREDGQIMYLRWEYTDTPHSHDRVLFHMNPDGTEQMEYYGSNSYWPNSLFYAQPVPDHPTRFMGIVSGHLGVPRMGELVLFDPARGRRESAGAIQRIPGYGIPVRSETG